MTGKLTQRQNPAVSQSYKTELSDIFDSWVQSFKTKDHSTLNHVTGDEKDVYMVIWNR